jgi:2-dehydro-3-deoxygluconokinase
LFLYFVDDFTAPTREIFMDTLNIAVIGECMVELQRQHNQIRQGFGGDTLNTAVYLARMMPAAQNHIHYITALGTDHFSDTMIATWDQEQVDTQLIQRLPTKLPGLYFIETDDQGERSFTYWRNDAAAKYWLESAQTETILQQLLQMQVIYLSGISLAILSPASRQRLFDFLATFRQQGGQVVFDNNYRPRLWASREETQTCYRTMLQLTDIAFLTLDDETELWGEESVETVVQRTQQAGVHEIIVKRGSQPCLIALPGQPWQEVPALKVPGNKVVDTTAAGDSFSAGYLSARLQQHSAFDSARQGHLLASTVIQYPGAIIPQTAMPGPVVL